MMIPLLTGLVDGDEPVGAKGDTTSVMSQRIVVPSSLPVARVSPSGENATELTQSVWPSKGGPSTVGVAGSVMSHRIAVPASVPIARVRPSGENATEFTENKRWVWSSRGGPSAAGA